MDKNPGEVIFEWIFFAVCVSMFVWVETTIGQSVRGSIHVMYWVLIAVIFAILVGFDDTGRQSAWINGYILEFTLSIDNLFVFHLIFREYKTPPEFVDKALIWGIALACIFRFIFFFVGVELFEWLRLVFGILLIATAYKAWTTAHRDETPSNPSIVSDNNREAESSTSWSEVLRRLQRLTPVVRKYDKNGRFLQFENSPDLLEPTGSIDPIDACLEEGYCKNSQGRLRLTMLALVVIVIGLVDAIFAIDAVAAKMSQSKDLFVNFSSSVLAMMSFRWLFGVVEQLASMFELLKYGIALILGYVGFELILSYWITVSNTLSCFIICGIVMGSVLGSVLLRYHKTDPPDIEMSDDISNFPESHTHNS
jgi:tellurite resistance protein TerC